MKGRLGRPRLHFQPLSASLLSVPSLTQPATGAFLLVFSNRFPCGGLFSLISWDLLSQILLLCQFPVPNGMQGEGEVRVFIKFVPWRETCAVTLGSVSANIVVWALGSPNPFPCHGVPLFVCFSFLTVSKQVCCALSC